MIKNYNIEDQYLRTVGASSLGMTKKYYKEGFWYKENLRGYEGKAEEIVSTILKHSNYTNFVRYKECTVNGKGGCRSENFLHEDEALLTFGRLYTRMYGGSLKNKIADYSTPKDRIDYVCEVVKEGTNVDCYNYLKQFAQIDYLTLDVDRHFGNLALLHTDNGYKIAPMFDFGASFFSLQHIFKPEMTLQDKYMIMTPQPFAKTFEEQMDAFGNPDLKVNYQAVLNELSEQPDNVMDIVKYQFEKCIKIFPEMNSKEEETEKSILRIENDIFESWKEENNNKRNETKEKNSECRVQKEIKEVEMTL